MNQTPPNNIETVVISNITSLNQTLPKILNNLGIGETINVEILKTYTYQTPPVKLVRRGNYGLSIQRTENNGFKVLRDNNHELHYGTLGQCLDYIKVVEMGKDYMGFE